MNIGRIIGYEVGLEIIHDTNKHEGDFGELTVTADTVIASMTWADGFEVTPANTDWSDLGSITAPAKLGGRFTDITLTSGKAYARKLSKTN